MNPGMKMMLVTNARKGESTRSGVRSGRYGGRMEYAEGNYARMDYDGAEGTYDVEDRYRGRRGMESRVNIDEPESRRRRDSRGRFRSEWEDGMESGVGYSNYGNEARMGGYPNRPFPVYEGGRSNMNLIGFDPSREIETNYPMNATHKGGNEMEYRKSQQMGGYSSSGAAPSLNMEMAEEWTGQMKNEDGTKGPHWKFEQVKQLMSQKGIQGNPVHLWVALNMLYSDYCAVFKKYGVNSVDLYMDLAMAFLKDTDAGAKDKLASYYQYVVKG